MKKNDRIFFLILLGIMLLVLWVYNNTYSIERQIEHTLTEEQMRDEIPELYITEEDYALCNTLAQMPELEEALKTAGADVLDNETVQEALVVYLPENASVKECGMTAQGLVWLHYLEAEEYLTCCEFRYEQPEEVIKSLRYFADRQSYENENNEEYVRIEVKDDRFAGFLDMLGLYDLFY